MKIALHEQIRVKDNISDGIHYSTCTHDCPDACNIQMTVQNGKITEISGDPRHEITRGWLCAKTPLEIIKSLNNNSNRLTHPLFKMNGEWKQISWDDATNIICEKITEYKKIYGPLSILHCHGGGSFAGLKRTHSRRFFSLLGGTSTMTGSICDSAAIDAQALDFGDQRTHAPNDMLNSKFIILWGKNPANTSPHFMEFLRDARKREVEIVLIDPIKTRTASVCSKHYQINPNTDKYLALAIGKIIIQKGLYDLTFINKYTIGFDDYKRLALSVDIENVASICGLKVSEIENLALQYAENKPSSIWLGFGLQRYLDGGEVFRIIDALGAITGNISKQGGGVNHQNSEVQKYLDYSTNLEDSTIKRRYLRKAALAEDIENSTNPPIKMIYVTTLNPVAQCPNSMRVKKAFEKTDFVVVHDSAMTDTVRCADLFLPTTRLLEEEDVMWAAAHHYIGLSKQILPAPGEAKSDFEIFQILAQKLGFGEEMSGDTKEWINKILSPVKRYGIDYDSLFKEQIINPNLESVAFSDYKFTTPSGKYNFVRISDLEPKARDNKFPFYFLTVHHHNWLNSNISLNKQREELGITPFAYINPILADQLNIKDGENVIVYSKIGQMQAVIKISEDYPELAVSMYQGGSVIDNSCANMITDDSLISDYGAMTAYYSTMVNLKSIG